MDRERIADAIQRILDFPYSSRRVPVQVLDDLYLVKHSPFSELRKHPLFLCDGGFRRPKDSFFHLPEVPDFGIDHFFYRCIRRLAEPGLEIMFFSLLHEHRCRFSLLHVPDLTAIYTGRRDYPGHCAGNRLWYDNQERIKRNTKVINFKGFEHLPNLMIDKREGIFLPHYHPAPGSFCHLKDIPTEAP